jgi:hypothetical protein
VAAGSEGDYWRDCEAEAMKNPFRAVKKVVTAPVRAVKGTARVVQVYARARRVRKVAAEAQADPRQLRELAWWSRFIPAAGDLYAALPLSKESRVKFSQAVLTTVAVLGTIGGMAGYLTDQGVMALLPEKHAATIGVVCGAAGTLASLLRNSPLYPKPEAQ